MINYFAGTQRQEKIIHKSEEARYEALHSTVMYVICGSQTQVSSTHGWDVKHTKLNKQHCISWRAVLFSFLQYTGEKTESGNQQVFNIPLILLSHGGSRCTGLYGRKNAGFFPLYLLFLNFSVFPWHRYKVRYQEWDQCYDAHISYQSSGPIPSSGF